MGYGYYSNGLLEGIIIGNMMHPAGTTMYTGGGYNGQALLYPNGQVVDSNGYQVGTYQNNQFVPMCNGPLLSQPAPINNQPVVIESFPSIVDIGFVVLLIFLILTLMF